MAEDLTNEGLGKAISNSSPLFKLLDETPNHCVNRITISVGRAYTPVQQTLTKQWFVVSGNISAGSEMIQGVYSAGQTFGVQVGQNMRICNTDSLDAVLIEIGWQETIRAAGSK